MCRFLAYSGEPILLRDLLYSPAHSLVRQSHEAHDEDDRLNADGFGVGWYAQENSHEPAVVRSPAPAWSSPTLRSLADAIRAGHFFAHVRSASEGLAVSDANCHPFTFGPLLWMHNGTLARFGDFRDWARRFLSRAAFEAIHGTTDSEYLFALFLDRWLEAGSPRAPESLLEAFLATLRLAGDLLREHAVKEESILNLALTDGKTTIASRLAIARPRPPLSLHFAAGVRPVADRGACRFTKASQRGGALIASEPLFDDPAWREVPPGHVLLVRPDAEVESMEIRI